MLLVVNTAYFGELEYEQENVIKFKEGILGFENKSEYVLILNTDPELPFHYLQSVEDSELMFIATSPHYFVSDYDFEIPDSVVEFLGIENPEDVMIYTLTVIPEETEKTSINLKAPLVINLKNKHAKQVVLDEKYRLKHYIFDKALNEEAE